MFTFRGKAPLICLAQPNGLGLAFTRLFRAKGPASCFGWAVLAQQLVGLSALVLVLIENPARWAGLGKLLGLWPESNTEVQLQSLRFGLGFVQLQRLEPQFAAWFTLRCNLSSRKIATSQPFWLDDFQKLASPYRSCLCCEGKDCPSDPGWL